MAGLLLLFLVIEEVCPALRAKYVALFSDITPTVGWAKRMAAKGSLVAMQLVRALALRLKLSGASPLTPQHIGGDENSMTDIPSRSFGSNPAWFCKTDAELLHLFNKTFPLPNQASWTVFSPSNAARMKVISVLRMQHSEMAEWQELRGSGKWVGEIGDPTSDLWEWTLGFRLRPTSKESAASPALQLASARAAMVEANQSKLAQSLGRSRPLARRSLWPLSATQQKHNVGRL